MEAMKYRSVIQKLGEAIDDGLYAAQRAPDEVDANLALPAGTAEFYQTVVKELPSAHDVARAALEGARDRLKRARDDRQCNVMQCHVIGVARAPAGNAM